MRYYHQTTREFLKDKLKRLQNQQTSDSTAEDTQMTSLVIDGQTLEYAMSYDCQRDFVALSVTCKTVICCRLVVVVVVVVIVKTTKCN